MVEYNAKANLVEKAQMYKNCAISIGGEVAPEARVAIAQAANDLLRIQGVDASFVAVQVGNGVNISARSMGAVNVQVIMESLGGGGHQTVAGVQLDNKRAVDIMPQIISLAKKQLEEIDNNESDLIARY